MNIHLVRQFVRSIAKQFFSATPTAEPPYVASNSHPKILPPFGGEMGTEIRSFLGRVEPWLRNGWQVMARRPEFYPPGTAFADPAYFARESALLQRYGCVRICYGYHFPEGSQQKLNIEPSGAIEVELKGIQKKLQLALGEVRDLALGAMFEKELRQLFAPYLLRPDRPPSVWDPTLLSVINFFDYTTFSDVTDVIVPSYKPQAFVEPTHTWPAHIGVQLRARKQVDPQRDSQPDRILALANQVSRQFQLPILIYGHPDGTYLPPGYSHTADQGIPGLLTRELGYLRSCQIMFAPDSGWAELMAWLQVPTLLEGMSGSHTFHWLKPFAPRMDLIQANQDILTLVERVQTLPECLPAPNPLLEPSLSPEGLIRAKQGWIET